MKKNNRTQKEEIRALKLSNTEKIATKNLFFSKQNTFEKREFGLHNFWRPKQDSKTACFYHVIYAFQSESIFYGCLNVKEIFAQNRQDIC